MHTASPDFPVSVPFMIAWALILLVAICFFVQTLLHLNRKGNRWIIGLIFIILLLAGTAIHVVLLARSSHTVTDGNWIQLTLVSFIAGLEMFIGHTVVFDDIIAAVIFREPALMITYITIFLFIIVYTLSMVILIMPRTLRDKTWLLLNERKSRKTEYKNHIFLGVTPHTKKLIQSILAQKKKENERSGEIILVEFPDKESHHTEISIGELFSNIFGREKERSLEDELDSHDFVLLKGKHPHYEKGITLGHAIGLDRLQPWFSNPRSSLYLLSEEEDQSFQMLQLLSEDTSIKAKTICYTPRANSYNSLFATQLDRVRLLNPEELSFMELKLQKPELHPIHFVDIARDQEGHSLGYVNSGISALLLGFREAGQEALRFLYEFGSFAGKDLEPVSNTFNVYDSHIDSLKGDFLNRTPALRYDASINWSDVSVGSSRFWLEFAMMLPSLNYVVITEDKGHRNVEIAVRLLQEAARYGKDLSKLCILVNAWEADPHMLDLIEFYNRSYCPEGISVIHPFGLPQNIWNLDVVTGKRLKLQSEQYADILRAQGAIGETWEERSKRLKAEGRQPGNFLRKHKELMRKQAGEIGRSLYAHTLMQLAGDTLPEVADRIPVELNAEHPDHYPVHDKTYNLLEHMAAGEHLHWMTALMADGYIDGNGQQDELNKKIKNLVPYKQLPDEVACHISWVAVKAALLWSRR